MHLSLLVMLYLNKCLSSLVQVSADEDNGCIQCSCDLHGSISQSCVADPSQATLSMQIILPFPSNSPGVGQSCFYLFFHFHVET